MNRFTIPMRTLRSSLCAGLLLGISSSALLAASTITVSELEKTNQTEGSLLLTLQTTDKPTAFETELVYDPKKVDVTAPGSLQVPGAEEGDFSVDWFKVSDGKLRVVLSSARILPLANGTAFRVPVRAAKGVAKIDGFFPVALSDMEISDTAGKPANPKMGTSLRIRNLESGAKVDGKTGVSLGLELVKDASVAISKVEYLANGKLIKTSSSVDGVSWTPPGSGTFQLAARVTLADGTKTESRMTPVIVTGVATPPVKGTYTGVVNDVTVAKAARATGTVQIATTTSGSTGSYSMRLVLNGTPLSAVGKFDAQSAATPSVVVRVAGAPKTFRIRLQQEAVGFGDAISGVVTDGTLSAVGEPSGGSFASSFVANRTVWVPKVNETGAMAGKYTLALPISGEVSDAPSGISLLTVSPIGIAMGRFSFSDGTRSVMTGTVSKDGIWQPYANLYAKAGFLAGELDFTDRGESGVLGGEIDWRRSASSLIALDGLGNKFTTVARGALFAVKSGTGNVQVNISGGGLSEEISQAATLTPSSVLQVPSSNPRRLSLRFDRLSGGLTGSFTAPGDAKATLVTGVVLQSEKRAIAYFVRNGEIGLLSVTALP
jgi:hypothetical protein